MREVKGADLDLGLLPLADEADVPIGDAGFDPQMQFVRDDDEQRLRRGDHPADGVELLHRAVDRGAQCLQFEPLARLDRVLTQLLLLLPRLSSFS